MLIQRDIIIDGLFVYRKSKPGPQRSFYFAKKSGKEVKSIGADFNADIHSCVADSVNLYCMVAEKTEKRQGRKRQGDYAAAQGAADRVP